MRIAVGQKALVTTSGWFFAPDGKSYRAVFGTIHGIRGDQETLGIRTNARSTNWYLEIGNMTIAGCQVQYAVKCDSANFGLIDDVKILDSGEVKQVVIPTNIYNADASEAGVEP